MKYFLLYITLYKNLSIGRSKSKQRFSHLCTLLMLSNVPSQSVNTNHLHHQLFFSNSSFTISLLHHWEYTERTQGSLILLTHALLSIIMQFPHTVFLYYLSLGSNKLGSRRTHLWLAERLSCTAQFSTKGSSLLPLPKELLREKWKYYQSVSVNPEIMMQITWQIRLVAKILMVFLSVTNLILSLDKHTPSLPSTGQLLKA